MAIGVIAGKVNLSNNQSQKPKKKFFLLVWCFILFSFFLFLRGGLLATHHILDFAEQVVCARHVAREVVQLWGGHGQLPVAQNEASRAHEIDLFVHILAEDLEQRDHLVEILVGQLAHEAATQRAAQRRE